MDFKPTDEDIRLDVEEELKAGISADYVYNIVDIICDDVIEDIKVSSDLKYYNTSDVRFALGRVILDKLNKLNEVKRICEDKDNDLARQILDILK